MNTTIHNIIVGKLWMENHGEMTIKNHTSGITCDLDYKAYSIFSSAEVRAACALSDFIFFFACQAKHNLIHAPRPLSWSPSHQPRLVVGTVKDASGQTQLTLKATWDKYMAIAEPGKKAVSKRKRGRRAGRLPGTLHASRRSQPPFSLL